MKNTPLLAIVVAATAALFVAVWSINSHATQITNDTISVPGFLNRPSVETSTVDINANGVHFAIPRNYLETAAIQTQYGAFFRIATSFPKFTGADAGTIEQFRGANWWKYPNTIIIALDTGDANRTREMLEGAAKGGVKDASFGLKLAKRYPYADVFVNFDNHIAFQCEQKGPPESGGTFPRRCREWVTVSNRVTFQCEFLRDQLRNWRAINDDIRALLRRFVVKKQAAAPRQLPSVKVSTIATR